MLRLANNSDTRSGQTSILFRAFLFSIMSITCAACSNFDSGPKSSQDELIISAAASTKEVVEQLTSQFHATTDTAVKVNLGSSSALAGQIISGAPADLFLSANRQWADAVKKSGSVVAMAPLLTNRLVIVVPASNPTGIKKPEDLLSKQVTRIALASENVPAGMYADQALANLSLLEPLIAQNKIVRGQDVRSALSYVERGEAEAGIVYSTDFTSAAELKSIYEFDPDLHDPIEYMLVLLSGEGPREAAQQFYAYLQSPEADRVYERLGFTRIR